MNRIQLFFTAILTAGLGVISPLASGQKYSEQYRPQYHFTPEKHWMNDPNGLVYKDGVYHFFYQYYPEGSVWGPMHWGHATSTDLVHWKHLPIALYPDKLGYIFSGSAVVDAENTAGFGKGTLVAIFTNHDPKGEKDGQTNYQTQGIAYSTDGGKTWAKYSGNPVIPNDKGQKDFRDPKMFWNTEAACWNLVLAAGDHLQFYKSSDLKNWTYLSSFNEENSDQKGVWECPDLFPITASDGTKKWVLILSHGNSTPNGGSGTRYFVGNWDGKTFTSEQKPQWIDSGADDYAGVTYNNTADRIMIGWMNNWQYATTVPTTEWRSATTIPKRLSLKKVGNEYALFSAPVLPAAVPGKSLSMKNLSLSKELLVMFPGLQTSDISVEFFSLKNGKILLKNKAGEQYAISFENGNATFDRAKAGQNGFNENYKKMASQTLKIGIKNPLKIRILVDKSSVECFLNDGEFVNTNQVFPLADYDEVVITGNKGAVVKTLKINKIASIWNYEK